MIDQKKLDLIGIIVIIAAVCITILFMNGEALGLTKVSNEDAEGGEESSSEYFSKSDLDGEWYKDRPGITKISLKGSEIKVSGQGAYTYNGDVIISKTGWYELNGSLDDGSVIVNADAVSKVWILLNDADIYASDDAVIRVDQADKVFLTLAEGSSNTLACGDTMSDEAEEDNTNGVIFAHDDITINGCGTLSIVSEYEHGIKAKDSLKICGGSISIDANADGIHVNDHFKMTDASVTIDAMDDGICSETDLLIASGKLLINNCYEGIESPLITVLDGDIEIYPDDDGFNANGGTSGFGNFAFFDKEESSDADEEEIDPCITIYGGSIKIINPDAKDADGMDSNKDIFIYGGNIFISLSGGGSNNGIDYGSESGGVCEIHGGSVISCGGSAMVEQFSETSSQASLLYNMGNNSEDEVRVSLTDAEDKVIYESVIPCGFNSLQLSVPEMQTGETYMLKIGDKEEEITLDSVSTTVGGISGFGGFGGMKPERTEKSDGVEKYEGMELPEGMKMPGGRGMPGGMMQRPDEDTERDFKMPFGKNDETDSSARFDSTEDKETVSTAKNLTEFDPSVWKYLAASVIVLSAALVSAKIYKRW
ncbi:MAG: carbohydrate-binding domain-containing protein [Lachnospiraceae bacterium]|nr:carbohydrate-binding domain-containing protein [Lachnospiraceae bacterium]